MKISYNQIVFYEIVLTYNTTNRNSSKWLNVQPEIYGVFIVRTSADKSVLKFPDELNVIKLQLNT